MSRRTKYLVDEAIASNNPSLFAVDDDGAPASASEDDAGATAAPPAPGSIIAAPVRRIGRRQRLQSSPAPQPALAVTAAPVLTAAQPAQRENAMDALEMDNGLAAAEAAPADAAQGNDSLLLTAAAVGAICCATPPVCAIFGYVVTTGVTRWAGKKLLRR